MIKVIWNQSSMIATQKLNQNLLTKENISLNDRISTFEGKEHLCITTPVISNTTIKSLTIIIENIAKHIIEVSGGNIHITSMTLYFKVDPSGRLWLLFCSRIKVRDYVSPPLTS